MSERRVVFVSADSLKLSSCFHSMQALMEPFSWVHKLVPVLQDTTELSFTGTPPPFVVGIQEAQLHEVEQILASVEVVWAFLDNDTVQLCRDELCPLPPTQKSTLKTRMHELVSTFGLPVAQPMVADFRKQTAEAFMNLMVDIFGDYRDFLTADGDFNINEFCASAQKTAEQQLFLSSFRVTGMFQRWVEVYCYGDKHGATKFDTMVKKSDPFPLADDGINLLRLRICTFNCGNAPPTDLSRCMTRDPEDGAAGSSPNLVVLGLQESSVDTSGADGASLKVKTTLKTLGGADGASKQLWVNAAQACLGPEFKMVSSVDLAEIRLMVWASAELLPHISEVETATEATGVAGVVGNKGGCCVKLRARGTTLAFFNCHLAAHEGTKKGAKRNADLQEIFQGARVGPWKWMDASMQFDHCFLMGDLNYRCDLRQTDGVERAHKKHWAEVKGLIDAGDFGQLWGAEQLTQEMAAKRVLVGFTEGKLSYPPTFKVERREDLVYGAKRIPSYTDRILWRSLPGSASAHTQEWVRPVTAMGTSDHKPMAAQHAILVPKLQPAAASSATGLSVTITITNLHASNLPGALLHLITNWLLFSSNMYSYNA
jgi:hypothetical protein